MFFGLFTDEILVTTAFEDRPQSAIVQIASGAENGTRISVACNFRGMLGKRVLLEATQALPSSTAVSIEYSDAMFLGEVINCAPETGGTWRVEVKVEQILTGLQSLIALRSRLLCEGVTAPSVLLPAGMRE
ncbi:MAG TPA: hypothetical protein VH601_01270 [Bryobacteraceae bacterium]|jgi:hypothetical protein